MTISPVSFVPCRSVRPRRSHHAPPWFRHCGRAIALLIAVSLSAHGVAAPQTQPANAAGMFGLYPATAFRLTTGACEDCPPIRQARWYFRDQPIAVPLADHPVAKFETGTRAFDDVRSWATARRLDAPIDYPALVWTGAPAVLRGARLTDDGKALATSEGAIAFRPVERIPLNRSYYDASSVEFFGSRSLTVRGFATADGFMARSIWPEDFSLGGDAPAIHALPAHTSATEVLRNLMNHEVAPAAPTLPRPCGSGLTHRARGQGARFSPSWSMAPKATTMKRKAGTSRS